MTEMIPGSNSVPRRRTTPSARVKPARIATESAPPLDLPQDMSYYDMDMPEDMEIVDLDPINPINVQGMDTPVPAKKPRRG